MGSQALKTTLIKVGIIIIIVIFSAMLINSVYTRILYKKHGISTFGKIISIKEDKENTKSTFHVKSYFYAEKKKYYTDDACFDYNYPKHVGDSIKVVYLKYNPNISSHDCHFKSNYSILHILMLTTVLLVLSLGLVFYNRLIFYLYKLHSEHSAIKPPQNRKKKNLKSLS